MYRYIRDNESGEILLFEDGSKEWKKFKAKIRKNEDRYVEWFEFLGC